MFRVCLLLVIRRYCPVCTAVGICHAFILTGCWQVNPANSQLTLTHVIYQSLYIQNSTSL